MLFAGSAINVAMVGILASIAGFGMLGWHFWAFIGAVVIGNSMMVVGAHR